MEIDYINLSNLLIVFDFSVITYYNNLIIFLLIINCIYFIDKLFYDGLN